MIQPTPNPQMPLNETTPFLTVAIESLNKIRRESRLWKSGGAGGQDQYAGLPPALRYVDAAIFNLEKVLSTLTATREQLEEMRKEAVKDKAAFRHTYALLCDKEAQLTALQSRLDRAEGASAKLEQMGKALKAQQKRFDYLERHASSKRLSAGVDAEIKFGWAPMLWSLDEAIDAAIEQEEANAALASSLNTEKL